MLLDDNNILNQTLRASMIKMGEYSMSVVMNTVINYFNQDGLRSKKKEAITQYVKAFCNSRPFQDVSNDRRKLVDDIFSVFGNISQGEIDFKRFADLCFE